MRAIQLGLYMQYMQNELKYNIMINKKDMLSNIVYIESITQYSFKNTHLSTRWYYYQCTEMF